MNQPIISIIAAIGRNRELGKNNKIPWHIKKDLVRFKTKTIGHVLIMGRKAFDSLLQYYQQSGRPIPQRTHIVVTSNKKYHVNIANSLVAFSFDQALKLAKSLEKDEIFISGGASIYKQAIHLANKLYLTVIDKNFNADVYFPDYSMFNQVISDSGWQQEGDYCFKFLELIR